MEDRTENESKVLGLVVGRRNPVRRNSDTVVTEDPNGVLLFQYVSSL